MVEIIMPVEAQEGSPSYSAAQFDDWIEAVLNAIGYDPATQGPLRYNSFGYGTLEVTGTTSPVSVASGVALVKGKLYVNTASKVITIPTPSLNTRIDRIVLRLDFTTVPHSCAAVRLAGTEGSGVPPELTQEDGVRWEISLARVSITPGGAITITDERAFVGDGGITTSMLAESILSADAAGRAKIANGFFNAATVAAKFAAGALTDANLLQLIPEGAFKADAPTRALFADGIWTAAKLASSSVETSKIAASAVTADKIATNAVTADKIAANAVTDDKIATNAVTGDKIAAGAVTVSKIASNLDASGIGFNADKVDGYHASDLLTGGVIPGTIVLWYGELGGSDGHRPVVGGTPQDDWHLCNGETVNGYATPDLRNRFPLGAGGNYTKGATGGATTINISHSHSVGSLSLSSVALPNHVHSVSLTTGSSDNDWAVSSGSAAWAALGGHTHAVSGNTGNPTSSPTHTHSVYGDTASALSSSQSIMPPYLGVYFIMKVA